MVAVLRDRVCIDLNELKQAAGRRLEERSLRPFFKREGTRRQVFEEQERLLLRLLPAAPYEVCEWADGRKLQKNCHASYKRYLYSASCLPVGKSVDLHVTDTTLEAYLGSERLATYPPYASNRYSTHAGDMSEGTAYREWDAGRTRR